MREGGDPVSHGICPLCFKEEMAKAGVAYAAEIAVDERREKEESFGAIKAGVIPSIPFIDNPLYGGAGGK